MYKIIISMALTMLLLLTDLIASLSVHPQQIKDTVAIEQNSIIVFHITNLGPSGSLGYELSASESWISFSTTAGNLNVKDTANIEILIDVTKLNQGINTANIMIGDPHHGPITIPIEIYVKTISDVYETSPNYSLLLQVFPNPINSIAELKYYLQENQNVVINVLDLNGVIVKSLLNEYQSVGEHKQIFDSSELVSGTYFLILKTEKYSIIKQLIINK